MTVPLSEQILKHSGRDELNRRMSEFYEEVDASITFRNPTCWNRGACCKFGSYGHRLFVTNVELAYFVRGLKDNWKPPTSADACPYQVEGKCTAREHRPLGCRIFFCDPNAQTWQGPESERLLTRLKDIGTDLKVPYRYGEWLSALREVSESLPRAEAAG